MRYGTSKRISDLQLQMRLARDRRQRKIDRLNEKIKQRALRAKKLELRRRLLAEAKAYWTKVHEMKTSQRITVRLLEEANRDNFEWQLAKAKRLSELRTHSPKVTYPIYIPFAPYSVTAYDWNSGYSTSVVNPSTLGVYQIYRNQVGTVTPHFKLIKRFKRNAPINAFQMELRWADSYGYSKQVVGPGGLGYSWTADKSFHKDWFQPIAFGDTITAEALNKAAGRLGDRVNKMHVNLAQVFAERHQTTALVINTVNRIRQAALCMRAGNYKGFVNALSLEVKPNQLKGFGNLGKAPDLKNTWFEVQRTPKAKRLANHWLEYTFGWTPLLSDIYGMTELVASHAVEDLYHEIATGKAKGKASRPFKRTSSTFSGWMEESCRVKYVVRYSLDSYSRAILSQTGLDNPALLMWELLPYSFVADWSLNVSNYLKRLTTFSAFTLHSGSVSKLWLGTVHKVYSQTLKQGDQMTYESGSAVFNQLIFTRQVLTDFPSVVPTMLNPIGKPDNWAWKIATSASLLMQAFKR